MDVGIVGLGRMGSGVATRLIKGGHHVVVYNRTEEKALGLVEEGAELAHSLAELVEKLPSPKVVWLYLPAGNVTEEHLTELVSLLGKNDCIIDGGNSQYQQTLERSAHLQAKGIHLVDVGTSGGVRGKENGFCLMIGGEEEVVNRLNPLWQSVAQEGGFVRTGATGAGHYVKMVHNAIEYGMMQAYGEGIELLVNQEKNLQLNLVDTTEVWQHGSIIRSFLGELLAEALHENPQLENVTGFIEDNGEGRWAVEEALDKGIALPVITAALFARYGSRVHDTKAQRTISVLRNKFGGHRIVK